MRKVDIIKANMDDHIARWREVSMNFAGNNKQITEFLNAKAWFGSRYRELCKAYAEAIDEDDSIIGKEFHYNHTRVKDFDR